MSRKTHVLAWLVMLLPALVIACGCLPLETYHLGILIYGLLTGSVCIGTALYFARDIKGIGIRVAMILIGAFISIGIAMIFGYVVYTHNYNIIPQINQVWLRYILMVAQIAPIYELVRYLESK